MSKMLTFEQRELMYQKRREGVLDFDNLSAILNTKKEYMVQAQIGKSVPSEVANALIAWME
jgi:hypothetical protein